MFIPAVDRMAKLLRTRRRECGISQRQLADQAGVNVSVVSRAEHGGDAKLGTWDTLFGGLGDVLLFNTLESSEEACALNMEEAERRILRRLDGLLTR
jgi:transcriptional regulator with XRE-family HTH domain